MQKRSKYICYAEASRTPSGPKKNVTNVIKNEEGILSHNNTLQLSLLIFLWMLLFGGSWGEGLITSG